jgi:hypothetical protein
MILNPKSDFHLNHWTCDERVFNNKQSLLLHASQHGGKIQYHYNDHVFSQFDWSIEPTQTLSELYAERARSLRDQYDYIVIMFSGGSDSTTVIESFLNAGIHIDEVISYGGWNHKIDRDTDAWNVEVLKGGRSIIERLKEHDVKFTMLNLLDSFDQVYQSNEWVLTSDHSMTIWTDFLQHTIFQLDHTNKLIEKGKKVCYVWGIEKPTLCVYQNDYYVVFPDWLYACWRYDKTIQQGHQVEFFFSDVACANIISKQCHTIINHLESRMYKSQIANFLMGGGGYTQEDVRNLILELCYPNWKKDTFTLGKHSNYLWSLKWQSFYHLAQDTSQYQTWVGGVTDVLQSINPKYRHPTKNLKPFYCQYRIRPLRSNLLST